MQGTLCIILARVKWCERQEFGDKDGEVDKAQARRVLLEFPLCALHSVESSHQLRLWCLKGSRRCPWVYDGRIERGTGLEAREHITADISVSVSEGPHESGVSKMGLRNILKAEGTCPRG